MEESQKCLKSVLIQFVIGVAIIFPAIFAYVNLKPKQISEVEFYSLLTIAIIVYTIIIKKFHLVLNSIITEKKEIKGVASASIFFISIYIFTSIFFKNEITPLLQIHPKVLFNAFSEEIIFRSFLLGFVLSYIILPGIDLERHRYVPVYCPTNKEAQKKSIITIIILGLLFSDLHLDWIFNPLKLLIRTYSGFVYGLTYFLTNRKIYAPTVIHYVNNVFALFG